MNETEGDVKGMEQLIAIDGNSLMHRAYWALPSMMTKAGTPTGAIFGFLGMLFRLTAKEPSHLVVAFDMHAPTFRHEEYADYKAGRSETPQDLRAQFPLLRELLASMKIKVTGIERYEADDLLGAYARVANEQGIPALLVTGDRDALQLIGPATHVLMTKKGVSETIEYDEAVLMEQYGLTPARMIDLKALMGDGSDNIPGIPGIGEKTAQKLLQKYGTMENALAHAESEKGALREKLLTGAESARMSYRLGTIETGVELPGGLEACRFEPATMALGIPLMHELELRSLIARLPGPAAKDVPTANAGHKTARVRVDNEAQLAALVGELAGASPLAVHVDSAFSVSAACENQADCVLGATLLDAGLDEGRIYEAFRPLFEDAGKGKVFFDSKRMRHAAAGYGIAIENVAFDAMIADYLLHATHPAGSLKTLAGERLGVQDAGAATLIRLWPDMRAELAQKGLSKLYDEVELPLVEVLFDMEREGFMLDRAELQGLSERFHARTDELAREIFVLAGSEFNILSPKQLGGVLFETLKLPALKKTKTGYSTDSEVLESLYDMHAIVPLILEYRTLSKLSSTFVDGLIALIRPTGRVHTSFNQNVAATGRISSTEPNLQNIPVRTDVGRDIRKAFRASPGCVLVDADYSQIELRLLAGMSGDPGMIRAFLEGEDIHRRTAGEVFGTPFEQVSEQQRGAAKAVNFGIVYGISDFGLSRQLGISRKEAASYIEQYFARYPGVQAFLHQCVEDGRREGCAKTLMGRRRDLPELASSNYNTRAFGERVAMNMPIQGTAADIIKLAMVRVHSALRAGGFKAKLILQIHDELIIDCPLEEAARVEKLLVENMQGVMDLAVPLRADVKTGDSWFDTK